MDSHSGYFDAGKCLSVFPRLFLVLVFLLAPASRPVQAAETFLSAEESHASIISGNSEAQLASQDARTGCASVQAAIESAASGETVLLESGLYLENLLVEKSLSIRSENKDGWDVFLFAPDPDSPAVAASGTESQPAAVELSGVNIHGTGGKSSPLVLAGPFSKFVFEDVCIGCAYPKPDADTLSIAIVGPANGDEVHSGSVSVAGTVSRTGACVFVNGVEATVADGYFAAENIRLVPGPNTIGVLAHDGGETAVAAVEVVLPATVDLEPVQVEIHPSSGSTGSTKVSGTATLTVANNGGADATSPYRIVLFEDIDAGGDYDETTDNPLGEETVPSGPGPGESTNVSIDYAGGLLFPDNRIYVFIDADDDVGESDENNNVAAT